MTETERVRNRLMELRDEKYGSFNAKLLPGVSGILGVRMPELRKEAKKLCRGPWRQYLQEKPGTYYEEYILRGLLTGMADMEWQERFGRIQEFVPEIDNWGVCDIFCGCLKAVKEHQEEMWQYVLECLESKEEYRVRFALVILLNYYIDETYIRQQLELINRFNQPEYYARMAAAWALSMCYVSFPEITMEYLTDSPLDDWTYNKALQKITESLQIDEEEKNRIRAMKRKKKPF